MAKLFFSLGDLSAENVVYHLLPYLKGKHQIFALVGKRLQKEVFPVGRIEDINATGIFEVLPKLGTILKTKRKVEQFLKREKPDLLVAVDAPGFNLPLIKRAKELGVKRVVYFILPQVWAWKEKRKYTLAKYSDLLIPILPFEREIFAPLGVEVFYAGHPSVEIIEKTFSQSGKREEKDFFVVFPGSRDNEIKRHYPVLKRALPLAQREFNKRAVILTFSRYKKLFEELGEVVLLDQNPQRGFFYIKEASFGWIKSGTTAFETALMETPHLIFYKVSPLTYWVAKLLVKVKHLHLANIILRREVVPELVQGRFDEKNLLKETEKLLTRREEQRKAFKELKKLLKPKGEGVLKAIAQKLNLLDENL